MGRPEFHWFDSAIRDPHSGDNDDIPLDLEEIAQDRITTASYLSQTGEHTPAGPSDISNIGANLVGDPLLQQIIAEWRVASIANNQPLSTAAMADLLGISEATVGVILHELREYAADPAERESLKLHTMMSLEDRQTIAWWTENLYAMSVRQDAPMNASEIAEKLNWIFDLKLEGKPLELFLYRIKSNLTKIHRKYLLSDKSDR